MRRAVDVQSKPSNHKGQVRLVAQPVVVALAGVLAVGSSAMAFTGDAGATSTASTRVTDQVTGPPLQPREQARAVARAGVRAPDINSAPKVASVDSNSGGSTGKLTIITATSAQRAARGVAANGMPVRALQAYRQAATRLAATGCDAPWYLLAGIGLAESDHGRVFGAVLGTNGRSTPLIRGPVLDGAGDYAAIEDSDDGRLDGDARWDRAVGPMQFIPQTWASYAADGDGDGVEDPYDLDDAAMAAGRYLCASGGDLSNPAGQKTALYSYNHSDEYVLMVSAYAAAYREGEWPSVPTSALEALNADSSKLDEASGEARRLDQRDAEPNRDSNRARSPQPARSPQADRDSHPKPAPRADPKPEPEPDPRPARDPKADPKPKPDPEPAPSPDPERDPKPNTPPKPDPKRDPPPKPEPKRDPPPKPVRTIVTSTLAGVPTACESAWCVADTNVGALAPWAEGGDLDGDCEAESGTAELTGLSEAGVLVRVTVQQSLLDDEVVKTSIKGFRVLKEPECLEGQEAPEADE